MKKNPRSLKKFYQLLSRKTAYSSRAQALKMEGTKSAADTLDFERSGREAFLLGRSSFMRRSGPRGSEDPAMSNSKSGLKSQTSKE